MPVPGPNIDDEVLLRVATGVASNRERESVVAWRAAAVANDRRYREIEQIVDALAVHERSLPVSSPPAVAALLHRAGRRQSRPVGRMKLSLLGGLAAGIALTSFALTRHPSKNAPARPSGSNALSTGPQQVLTAVLGDGTRVQLGPASNLRASVNGETREVWLEGRAEFTVARLQGRRFVVHTNAGDAADIGTRFVVRADSAQIQVAVFEGRVALSAKRGTAEAGAGEVIAARLNETPKVTRLTSGHSSSDWLRAALVFEGASLDDVARTLAKHYGIRVSVPRELANQTVTGWFVDEPTVTQAFTAICRAVGATCSVNDTTAVFSR